MLAFSILVALVVSLGSHTAYASTDYFLVEALKKREISYPLVEGLIRTNDYEKLWVAIKLLAEAPDEKAVDLLAGILAGRDPYDSLALNAVRAFQGRTDRKSYELLERFVFSEKMTFSDVLSVFIDRSDVSLWDTFEKLTRDQIARDHYGEVHLLNALEARILEVSPDSPVLQKLQALAQDPDHHLAEKAQWIILLSNHSSSLTGIERFLMDQIKDKPDFTIACNKECGELFVNLGKRTDTASFELLERLLLVSYVHDGVSTVWPFDFEAEEALLQRNDAGLFDLIRRLARHESADMRVAATKLLKGRNEPQATELIEALLKDPEDDVRHFATRALEGIKDEHSLDLLVAQYRGPDAIIRNDAALALPKSLDGRVDDKYYGLWSELLAEKEYWVRDHVARAFYGNKTGDPRVHAVLEKLTRGADFNTRATIAMTLDSIGDKVALGLLDSIFSRLDYYTQGELLEGRTDAGALEHIENLINDCNLPYVNTGMAALAKRQDEGSLQIIKRNFNRKYLQPELIQALLLRSDPASLEFLDQQAAADPGLRERVAAAKVLYQPSLVDLESLERQLNRSDLGCDSSGTDPCSAIEALGLRKDPASREVLLGFARKFFSLD